MASRTYIPATNLKRASEHSYGLIPLRLKPIIAANSPTSALTPFNTEILLINQRSQGGLTSTFWTFPKGHAERRDKSILQSARREVREETGLIIKEHNVLFRTRDPSTGSERLSVNMPEDEEGLKEAAWCQRYMNPVRGWIKEVRYWVAVVDSSEQRGNGEIRVQAKELAGAKWCEWDEAEKLITFEEGRTILREVKAVLNAGVAKGDSRL